MRNTALVIVDIQNDYFPGWAFPLEGAEKAAQNVAGLLAAFRRQGKPVVHVRHEAQDPATGFFLPGTEGAEIHPSAAPQEGEAVVVKHFPNSFLGTGLEKTLRELGVERLVVAGMMTLMCVDATVRAAKDLGFEIIVAHDACAARALEFEGTIVSADHVHAAFLAALQFAYAEVADTETIVDRV